MKMQMVNRVWTTIQFTSDSLLNKVVNPETFNDAYDVELPLKTAIPEMLKLFEFNIG